MFPETTIGLRTSTPDEAVDKVTCSLCRRQFAKYTCPTCNVPYCSLTCFRSQAHNRCSETFYKKEIEAEIRAEPSKNAQERQRMMDLLKKFEEESVVDQTLLEEDEAGDEDPSDLVRRFGAVDLDSATPDALWAMLTSAERSKFMTTVNNPTGKLAQQLLASEALEKEIQDPWWEALRSSNDDSRIKENLSPPRCDATPRMMDVPLSMVNPNRTGHYLVYNICALLISYAYITRHLGISSLCSLRRQTPEYSEARRLVSRLAPFLTDRKSTKIYSSLTAITTEIWSALELGVITNGIFSLILRDAAQLLTPLFVTESISGSPARSETTARSHPNGMTVLALSDLHDVFSIQQGQDGDKERSRLRGNHITQKLIFYAAHVLSTPTVILRALVQEMMDKAETISPIK